MIIHTLWIGACAFEKNSNSNNRTHIHRYSKRAGQPKQTKLIRSTVVCMQKRRNEGEQLVMLGDSEEWGPCIQSPWTEKGVVNAKVWVIRMCWPGLEGRGNNCSHNKSWPSSLLPWIHLIKWGGQWCVWVITAQKKAWQASGRTRLKPSTFNDKPKNQTPIDWIEILVERTWDSHLLQHERIYRGGLLADTTQDSHSWHCLKMWRIIQHPKRPSSSSREKKRGHASSGLSLLPTTLSYSNMPCQSISCLYIYSLIKPTATPPMTRI